MAPSLDKPVTVEFQSKVTPHSSARSTIFSWRVVRRIPKPLAPEKLASTELSESTKRIPRKTCPSPGRIATPSPRSALKVPGINPSPQALSMGGFAPSATITSKPFIRADGAKPPIDKARSEEHTSELQSQSNLVCRLLLEKKKKYITKQSQQHKTELQSHSKIVYRLLPENNNNNHQGNHTN